jgi:hypothetical protein
VDQLRQPGTGVADDIEGRLLGGHAGVVEPGIDVGIELDRPFPSMCGELAC